MATVTKPIALDESLNTTELSSRNVADVLAQELSAVATAIGGISAPSAEDVSYDNSGSGLSATDVQNALDEIVSDIPTVNDGTLTIQQNGETKGTFTANQSGNSTVNIETPTTDIQTAVDEFSTFNGGLLSECNVTLEPVQDLHGYENPWVGGASKNKLPLVLADIKSNNMQGTWSGNSYTYNGVTFTVNTDIDENVTGIETSGSASGNGSFYLCNGLTLDSGYILNGCPSTGGSSTYRVRLRYGSSDYFVDTGSGAEITSPVTSYGSVDIRFNSGTNLSGLTFYPMIRLASESDPTFAPYSNICPISGHTQVDVDVSDGQTTQEQVTVNLGGTYYSGTLDVVSGVLTITHAEIDLGTLSWIRITTNVFRASNSGMEVVADNVTADLTCEIYKKGNYTGLGNGEIAIRAGSQIWVRDSTVDNATIFTNQVNGKKLVYPLATPTTIQLSPTMVKALVGENHLSAPLEGQEITESKYKQTFTFDDVNAQIESTYSEGISHNSVYRGKYLGDHVTDEQWDAIGDGSFRDLYIGDYWTINGINWRIAHFNYWLGTGDVKCNTNHVVIVPYGWVSTFNMNASDDTTGGYLNSEWYTTNRHFAVENIEADFGASHILSHRNFFSDAVSDGHASHGMWVDSTVDLMNEIMVCGSLVGSYLGKYYEVGCDKFQLALFKYNPPSARMDVSYWLRGVSTASSFVAMGNFGLLDGFTASQILKIRPVFAIKK